MMNREWLFEIAAMAAAAETVQELRSVVIDVIHEIIDMVDEQ